MSEESPKLYTNKPNKAQVKQFQAHLKVTGASSSSSSPAPPHPPPSSMGSASTPPAAPPQPPKGSFGRRYKLLWPLFFTVNLGVGAYLFMGTKKQDEHVAEEEAAPDSAKTANIVAPASVVEESLTRPAIVEPVKAREPIPVDQQRELFKWILEEKRKMKPKDREEKKRIDEDKAILKEFIRAKSIPNV